jgi:hypothetical protein
VAGSAAGFVSHETDEEKDSTEEKICSLMVFQLPLLREAYHLALCSKHVVDDARECHFPPDSQSFPRCLGDCVLLLGFAFDRVLLLGIAFVGSIEKALVVARFGFFDTRAVRPLMCRVHSIHSIHSIHIVHIVHIVHSVELSSVVSFDFINACDGIKSTRKQCC